MSERMPPKLASWLLEHCGPSFHGHSLQGDLFEQYQEGRSHAWYWRQVAAAVWIARLRFIRTMPWMGTARVLSREFALLAFLLAGITIADRGRRAHSMAEMLSPNFLCTLAVLMAAAVVGLLIWSVTAKGQRSGAALRVLMWAFGVMALGAGTLTWAGVACHCHIR